MLEIRQVQIQCGFAGDHRIVIASSILCLVFVLVQDHGISFTRHSSSADLALRIFNGVNILLSTYTRYLDTNVLHRIFRANRDA